MTKGDNWSGRKVTTARTRWAATLPAACWLCHRPVLPGTPWVVEHDPPRWVQRRQGVTSIPATTEVGVSHRACSDSSGGRTAAQLSAARRPRPSSSRARRLEDRPLAW